MNPFINSVFSTSSTTPKSDNCLLIESIGDDFEPHLSAKSQIMAFLKKLMQFLPLPRPIHWLWLVDWLLLAHFKERISVGSSNDNLSLWRFIGRERISTYFVWHPLILDTKPDRAGDLLENEKI